MTLLKASFTGPREYRSEFSAATAQLTISVGQSVHEAEKLAATVALINHSFAECKILIDDSIQWYTLAIAAKEIPASELLQIAIVAGDRYLERNEVIFKSGFTIPYKIFRWRDWLKTPAWQNAVQTMHHIYQHNTLFRQAIDQNVTTFLERYERNQAQSDYDRNHAWNLCVEYLLEECGVMKDLWVTLGCQYEVYPSGRNEAMTMTYSLFIKQQYPNLLRSVGLRFNRRGLKTIQLTKGICDDTQRENCSSASGKA